MSSKINEHDLEDSVFEGLALEETSQKIYNLLGGDNAGESSGGVAKAEDVQEILEKVESNADRTWYRYLLHQARTSGTQTLLNITGSGKLYYMDLYYPVIKSKKGVLTIKVDERAVLTISFDNSSYTNTNARYIGLSNKDFVVGVLGGYPYYWFNGTVESGSIWNNTVGQITENSSLTFNYLMSSGGNYYTLDVIGYIKFNESLVITCTNCATDNDTRANICYSLDEE